MFKINPSKTLIMILFSLCLNQNLFSHLLVEELGHPTIQRKLTGTPPLAKSPTTISKYKLYICYYQ